MKSEKQMMRQSIADHNKQHRKGSLNYVEPTHTPAYITKRQKIAEKDSIESTSAPLIKKMAGKMGKEEWHSIGAGRIGDKYKGGTIIKMDMRNARAKIKYT